MNGGDDDASQEEGGGAVVYLCPSLEEWHLNRS